MACAASASTSSIILLTDPPLASAAVAALFSFHLLCVLSVLSFFFSTVIHKFAQTFLRNFIDAENGKVYLPPQIEPEA